MVACVFPIRAAWRCRARHVGRGCRQADRRWPQQGCHRSAAHPIYVSYFTAWPDKTGTVRYFDDVYDRDSYMLKAMAATDKARRTEG